MNRNDASPSAGREPATLLLGTIAALDALDFDAIIDVRSPAEFAEDHVPGAINLPVLSNEERARVGTIYKQVSAFDARKIGAALVARNAALHLETALSGLSGGWRPMVYCWRGGQRSGSFASILAQVGWRVTLLAGGYKSWRRLVVAEVQETPLRPPVVVLDGNTGSAKTEVLAAVAAAGGQVIDLEGLANHRGSLFGAMPGGQPSQKAFEGRLARVLARLDPARPVLVEAESSRVGDLIVPRKLWAAMCAAPRVRLAVPLEARAEYLARAYAEAAAEPGRLVATINQMRRLHPAETIADWLALAEAGAHAALARALMHEHYDPRYGRQRIRHAVAGEVELPVARLYPEDLPGIALRVMAAAGM
ncbi:MAG: tRNA 2-selenouridine(34) synthase MnmH [Phaeovulum sp.]|uniref:tRNA 2-selenouridine(34) synthase MnmH n=1 Tax=Phaeovulum sp. TaxID=2934796 RepID=UPI0027339329|nr:tRNA 2-selenouridine(34) synthase MnmH [Phaeovulum sp.]MDP3860911.1 tRNA 2-selenouridine(34) synthase MnmH [Phaeovulum sp.]